MYQQLLTNIVDFDDDLFRNITRRAYSPILAATVITDSLDKAIFDAAKSRGLQESTAPVVGGPFNYGSVITYNFQPTAWHQSRFSAGTKFGCWYGSLDQETTIYETVYHSALFVRGFYPGLNVSVRIDRDIFTVRCRGILIDLRAKHVMFPELINRNSYTYTNGLGDYLYYQNQNGLLVQSARHNGINAALYRPEILANPQLKRQIAYVTNPSRDIVEVHEPIGTLINSVSFTSLS